jgi:hypothetical protein
MKGLEQMGVAEQVMALEQMEQGSVNSVRRLERQKNLHQRLKRGAFDSYRDTN